MRTKRVSEENRETESVRRGGGGGGGGKKETHHIVGSE